MFCLLHGIHCFTDCLTTGGLTPHTHHLYAINTVKYQFLKTICKAILTERPDYAKQIIAFECIKMESSAAESIEQPP
jgi:hypothetical protein